MQATLGRFLIVIGLLAMFSVPARADQSLARPIAREAQKHLDQGNRLYKQARWEEAIREYEAGAKIEPTPVFDYNLGQCHRKRGEYQAALLYYDRFLTKGHPEGEVLGAVQAFMAEMRAQLANRALTMPPSDPEPSAAQTEVPTPRRDDIPRMGSEREGTERSSDSSPQTTAPQVDRERTPNWLGWTALGVGIAGIGASGYLFLRASAMTDAANAEPDFRARSELRNGANTRTLGGTVSGIAGVALVTTGVVLLVIHRPEHPRGDQPSVSVGVTGRGVTLYGRF